MVLFVNTCLLVNKKGGYFKQPGIFLDLFGPTTRLMTLSFVLHFGPTKTHKPSSQFKLRFSYPGVLASDFPSWVWNDSLVQHICLRSPVTLPPQVQSFHESGHGHHGLVAMLFPGEWVTGWLTMSHSCWVLQLYHQVNSGTPVTPVMSLNLISYSRSNS